LSISSSKLTALPAGLVWKPVLRFWSKLSLPPDDDVMWEVLVRSIAKGPIAPVTAPVESNFGSTRSRGLKFGVSELETF